MPELPEVETVRRGLSQHVAGRVVADVEVLHSRAVRRHVPGAADLESRVRGQAFTSVERRGKYLWIPLGATADDRPTVPAEALLLHLGMSGQLLVVPAGTPPGPHLRVRMAFRDGGRELRFVDQRTFGGLLLDRLVDGIPASVAHIALDPLDPRFDDDAFLRALRARRSGVKRALLDQSLISGVGNIYADEALWRAQLHYDRPGQALRRGQAGALLAAVKEVLGEAVAAGGTSFDALYVDVNGSSGYFARSLNAYGQAGRPCRRCATPVMREPFMGRSSFRCPTCQPAPRPRSGEGTGKSRTIPTITLSDMDAHIRRSVDPIPLECDSD